MNHIKFSSGPIEAQLYLFIFTALFLGLSLQIFENAAWNKLFENMLIRETAYEWGDTKNDPLVGTNVT